MGFEVGEVIELIADAGYSCGEYTIISIDSNTDRVEFINSRGNLCHDRIWRCKKIIKPGQQLEFDW